MSTTNKVPDAWDDDDWAAKTEVSTRISYRRGVLIEDRSQHLGSLHYLPRS